MSRGALVRVACALVLVAFAVERLHAFVTAPSTDFDDAYMFIRYANNWIAGHGLAWNPGERSYGVTGLAHVFAVAALRLARPAWSDARVLKTASLGAAALAIAALAFACARLASHELRQNAASQRQNAAPPLRSSPLAWAALLVPLTAYSEPFAFHVGTGMDTMSSLLANACLLCALARLVDRPSRGGALVCALAGYAAIFARPDNALYAFAGPLLALVLVVPRGRALVPWFLAPLALAVGADLAIKRALLGTALPLALYAKRPHAYGGFVGEYTWNPFLFLEVFARAAAPFAAVVVVLARRRYARRLIVLLAPAALTLAAFFAVNQIMGHLGRFYFPSLPWLVAGAAVVLDGELDWWRPARLAACVAALFAVPAALEWAGARYERRAETQPLADLGGYSVPAREALPEMDSWRASLEIAQLAAASPPGTRFAMSEHGVVGARAARAVIIDLVGLHDREFALHGFSARELFRRAPDAIWFPHWDYTQMIRELLDSDELWRDYVFYPDAFTYGVALRRDAVELRARFAARFAAAYPGLPLDDYQARKP
jgi:hypothetical protein